MCDSSDSSDSNDSSDISDKKKFHRKIFSPKTFFILNIFNKKLFSLKSVLFLTKNIIQTKKVFAQKLWSQKYFFLKPKKFTKNLFA